MTERQISAEELRDNWPAVLLRPGPLGCAAAITCRHQPAVALTEGKR